jgi:Flp pilus assembly protein TadD
MRRLAAAASGFLALGLLLLTGCEDLMSRVDPLDVNGRRGAEPLEYATLMRLGAVAHATGNLETAIGFYRRAAIVKPGAAAPLVATGNTLLEGGHVNEAIVSYNSALSRDTHDAEALRGLAKSYLMTGKPELAGAPLAVAYQASPNDPKLLQLIGVADDFVGQHEDAQARYRLGLQPLPRDPALTLDLALSLTLSGNYADAVAMLRPLAMAPTATARERQTLALIYGLQGNRTAAAAMARRDLDPVNVQKNLAFYESLRRLSPEARSRAIQSLGTQNTAGTASGPGQPS